MYADHSRKFKVILSSDKGEKTDVYHNIYPAFKGPWFRKTSYILEAYIASVKHLCTF